VLRIIRTQYVTHHADPDKYSRSPPRRKLSSQVKGRYAVKPGTRAAQAPARGRGRATRKPRHAGKSRHIDQDYQGPTRRFRRSVHFVNPVDRRWPTSVSLYSSYFLNRRTALARPGWVEVIGGRSYSSCPPSSVALLWHAARRSPWRGRGSRGVCPARSSNALLADVHDAAYRRGGVGVAQVIIGMDPHKRSATIEIIDGGEKVLAHGRYGTDTDGYRPCWRPCVNFGSGLWAVEGCNGIGRHIAQRLVADGETVIDVPAKLSARVRVFATGHGRKTEPGRCPLCCRRCVTDRGACAESPRMTPRLPCDFGSTGATSSLRPGQSSCNRLHVLAAGPGAWWCETAIDGRSGPPEAGQRASA
jgi:hypothetical protein